MKTILNLAVLLLSLAVFSACSSDKDNPEYPQVPADAVYDIVTLTATTASSSTFTVQKDAGSAPTTYFSSVSFAENKTFPVGSRMLIIYKMLNGAKPYTSGSIELYGYAQLNNTEKSVLTGDAADYEQWISDPVKMVSMWRTGDYLNVHALMFATTVARPTGFILVADETTLGKPVIESYLIVKSNTTDGGNQSPVYGSFNIKTLLDIETCETVRVNYFDVSGFTHTDIATDHTTIRPVE